MRNILITRRGNDVFLCICGDVSKMKSEISCWVDRLWNDLSNETCRRLLAQLNAFYCELKSENGFAEIKNIQKLAFHQLICQLNNFFFFKSREILNACHRIEFQMDKPVRK